MSLRESYLMYKNDGGSRPFKSWMHNPSPWRSIADARIAATEKKS